MMIKKTIILALVSLAIINCSSTKKKETAETQEDKVLSRIDDLKDRPEWVKESKPFYIESGAIHSLGQTMIPGDHRVEASFRIAENNAKAAIATAVEQKLEFIFQNAEEGTSLDATQARYIGSEFSKITTSSIKLKGRYWEKIATTQDNGERVTRYRVFSLVEMPEEDFKKAVLDAARKSQGKQGISAEFAEKVNKQWDKMVDEQSKQ